MGNMIENNEVMERIVQLKQSESQIKERREELNMEFIYRVG
jgi:hypothetical protein